MDTKIRPLYMLSTRHPPQTRLKVTGWKNISHENRNQKIAGVAIKIDFKIKTVTRDKEGHCIIIKGSIQEENVTITNIYVHRSTYIHKANANNY